MRRQRTVLITGGASGMGKACARRFLEEGDAVFIADVNEQGLAAAVTEFEDLVPPVDETAAGSAALSSLVVDVRDSASCAAMVAAVLERAGGLDVLVTSAGVWTEGPTETASDEEWDRVIDINLRGVFYSCRAAVPALRASRGCIVNVGSRAGEGAVPEALIYCVSKAGVNMLTRSLALELAPALVRVNAVCPSDVDTPFLQAQARDYGGDDPAAYLDGLRRRLPQGENGRFVKSAEVADLVFYLSSPSAQPITGECIRVDFGISAR
jgi:NAD(P)-dependent dehydrogenase (short-subunit alcohol dehydrogenase family)